MKYLSLAFLIITFQLVQSQTEGSSFNNTGRGGTATTFATDYQALGINPANIGLDSGHTVTFGFGEVGLSFYSSALAKTDVQKMFLGGENPISEQEAIELGRSFAEAGMTVNYDLRAFGMSIDMGKAGGLAFAIDTRASHYSIFGTEAARLIFEGYDYTEYFDTIITTPEDTFGVAYDPVSLSEITDGTKIQAQADVAFRAGWSFPLFYNDDIKVYLGVGVSYILSYGYFDFKADGSTIEGISAISANPFELDNSDTPSPINNDFKPVGKGWGFDLGATIQYGDKLTFGASVLDLGRVKYTANAIVLNDYILDTVSFSGVDYTNPVLLIKDIVEDEALLEYNGIENFNASLPTRFRIGAGFAVFKNLQLGADLVVPLTSVAGSYAKSNLGLGAELRFARIFNVSGGVSFGGGYKPAIPFGFGIDLGFWELGLATRDITTWFGQGSPYASIAGGFLRFKI